MKKLKNACKKAVAMIEVAAMTMAIVSGISLADFKNVSAEIEPQEIEEIYSGNQCYAFGAIGDEVVLEPIVYDQNFVKVDVEKEGWIVSWQKMSYDGEDEELVFTNSYTIPSLDEDDIGSTYLYIVSKDGNTALAQGFYIILGAEDCVKIEEPTFYASVGDTITLTLEATDYYGNPIDLENDNYTITWAKCNGMELEPISVGTSYVIESIEEQDFDDNGAPAYAYAFTNNNGVVVIGFIHIYEGAPEIETPTEEIETTTGEIETSTDAPETTTVAPETEAPTKAPETTTVAPTTEAPTKASETTTVAPTTVAPTTKAAKVKKPAKAKIKKVYSKKKASKVAKIKVNKVKNAVGYQVQIAKDKKFKSKNILVKKYVKKLTSSITSKKLKNKKKLYVRVRAYVLNAKGKKVYGKWSTVKKVKIK